MVMNKFLPIPILALALVVPMQAADNYVPWPTKEQLRKLQINAFTCSRENTEQPCAATRSQADALMDHPRLPGLCKDVLWELVETAEVAPKNDYKRRDAIDIPAKRLGRICAEPIKRKQEPKPGAPKPEGSFGFGTSF